MLTISNISIESINIDKLLLDTLFLNGFINLDSTLTTFSKAASEESISLTHCLDAKLKGCSVSSKPSKQTINSGSKSSSN